MDSDRLWIAAGKKVKEKKYWLGKLAGELVKSSFPSIDEKETETAETRVVNFQFNDNVSSGLMKLSTGSDVRLHIVLTAVLTLLLGEYTGNFDIVLGTPILKSDIDTDRDIDIDTDSHADVINTVLVLRNQLAGDMTFKELLLQVRQTIIEADEHRNYPIELLVHQLHLPVHGDDFPLFDVAILLENIHDKQYLHHVKPRIIFSFSRMGESIRGQMEYSTSFYSQAAIEKIIGHFQYLVEVVLADTSINVSDIKLLSMEERRQLLFDFSDTKSEYPGDKTIHQLFEEQAAQTPDRIAIHMTHMTHMTYIELNKKSNQLARLLKEKGIAPNSIVGIMMEKSIEMIIGILGILKAGGAYLPIEPDYPEERIRYMLADSGAKVLITAGPIPKSVSVGVHIDSCRDAIYRVRETVQGSKHISTDRKQSGRDKSRPYMIDALSLAYVLYTSGTTGRPKGVMVEQRNVVRLVKNTNYIQFKRGDRLLQTGVLAFDASTFEIWGTLLNGLELYLVEKETLLTPEKLKKVLYKYDISTMWMTSPLFNQMVDADIDIFYGLRNLLVGGDVLSTRHINRVRKRFPSLHIINGYGPTENTTFSTTFPIERDYEERIPIGKPIANSTAYIVDKYDNIVPIGVTGELWVGGDGVARGYLNNPDLTAEKFDQDFQDFQDDQEKKEKEKATGKLRYMSYMSHMSYLPYLKRYRTGDLARWRDDGHIEFLGRIDRQLKIRGFRVELEEIENQLLTHEKVKEAKVIAKEMQKPGGERDKYLCAYIVPPAANLVEASEQGMHMAVIDELKDYLSHSLPDFMIPGFWVILEKFPLTTNGKVDTKALPDPDMRRSAVPYAAPQDEIQQRLVKTWVHVLDLADAPGIDDNFFQLGGHSLKATTMVQHIFKDFETNIEIADVFTHPTIREMAQRIKELEETVYVEGEITPVEEKEYYPLSHAQRRLWVLCQLEKDSTAYNMPAALTLSGSFNVDVFIQAVQVLVDRHESLRTLFILEDGEPRQKIIKNVIFDLEQVDLRALDEKRKKEKARQIYLEDASRVFHLEFGPLFRFKLVRLENKEYLLIHNMHHIVNDGWSQGIIINEFALLYNTFLRGGENPLSPLAFQYKDYTQWHNRLVETDGFKHSCAYWAEKFKDKPNGIELPLDHPRKAIQTFNGGRVTFIIDREKTTRLHQLSFEEDATLFMNLLTLLCIFLYRYSGQADIIIGAPIANRKQPELYSIIGFFVNTLVYRKEINPERSFKEQLKLIKEEAMACYQNQDYPFDLLVEQLGLDRDLSQSPLFNVMLAHNNTETKDLEMALQGVTISHYAHIDEINMSKFDLIFFMDEMDQHQQVNIRLEYNSDLFERSTIERMRRNFLTLVDHIIDMDNDGTAIPISALNIISKNEYERILHQFNATHHPFPLLTLQQLVENQVEASREKTAVVYNGEHITYEELNQKSNQLAHYLREEYAVHPNHIIGISVERSIDMIVTLLGILKSGAAYLALDPSYPKNRILYMLQDSQAKVVIVDKATPPLSQDYNGNIIDIQSDWDKMAKKSIQSPNLVSEASDILYVTYTSGSTGIPNGAMVSHHILTNLIQWQKENTSIDGSLRCLQFASINFDVSFQEIMSTLTAGGELYLIGEMERKDINYLMDFLRIHCIEVLYLPFYYLNFLFTETHRWSESFRHSLKHIVTAGEQLIITPGLKSFLDLNPCVQLHNHYGPAEMHVVTSYTMDASTVGGKVLPPIGKPISNVEIYILDEGQQPVPVGVWGEIHIVGPTSFVGYLNKPDLTHKKLVMADVCVDGRRLYRAGDIGRWMEDGNIELKGRKDFQVKIRGFRIEPGEIESKILSIPQVKECVVKVFQNRKETQQKNLAAYVVTDGIEISEIRQHISNELPQYMIPHFVVLDRLPLLPNGKVDRDKLPEPEIRWEEVYTAPADQVEEKLVHIWSEVLGIERERIGVHSDFFQLGGHSLNAATVVSKIHKELDAKVELAEVFKNPTIRGISSLIKAIQWANVEEINLEQEMEEVTL
jgi:amino acid adenylation domain-containing protein